MRQTMGEEVDKRFLPVSPPTDCWIVCIMPEAYFPYAASYSRSADILQIDTYAVCIYL